MHFVSADWVTASAAHHVAKAEGPYATPGLRAELLRLLSPCESPAHPSTARAAQNVGAAATAPGDAGAGAVAAVAAAAGAAPEATIPGWGLQRWGPPGWTAEAWGGGGVWLEPFDAERVNETLQALFAHYHRTDRKDGEEAAGAGAHGAPQFSGTRVPGAAPPPHFAQHRLFIP